MGRNIASATIVCLSLLLSACSSKVGVGDVGIGSDSGKIQDAPGVTISRSDQQMIDSDTKLINQSAQHNEPQKAIDAYLDRASRYVISRQFKKAFDDFTKITKIEPDYARAYLGRTLVYVGTGLNERAVAECSKSIELDPKEFRTCSKVG